MADSWTELWSFGAGRSRVYCGVARTEEGFAVDVFRGDWCIDSEEHPTRATAVRAALAREHLYHGNGRDHGNGPASRLTEPDLQLQGGPD